MQKKVRKIFLDFGTIAFELVALNTPFYWENILVIRGQYANKECQDFRYLRKSIFGADFPWEWSKNTTKILLYGFKPDFRLFNMLTVYKSSDTGIFGSLSNSAFSTLWFHKEITSEEKLFF